MCCTESNVKQSASQMMAVYHEIPLLSANVYDQSIIYVSYLSIYHIRNSHDTYTHILQISYVTFRAVLIAITLKWFVY